MPVTQDDLHSFQQFASRKLSNGGAQSLVELAQQWETTRHEYDQAVADVQQGLADEAQGKAQPLAAAFDDIRKKLGIAK